MRRSIDVNAQAVVRSRTWLNEAARGNRRIERVQVYRGRMSDASGLTWAPDACTLPTAERPLRRAEFDGLFVAATDVERQGSGHARLWLTGGRDLACRVRDLAVRENECCSFFAFTVTEQPPDRVVLDIEVPPGHIDVLDALVERARQVRAGR
jgi:hypothetical protein